MPPRSRRTNIGLGWHYPLLWAARSSREYPQKIAPVRGILAARATISRRRRVSGRLRPDEPAGVPVFKLFRKNQKVFDFEIRIRK